MKSGKSLKGIGRVISGVFKKREPEGAEHERATLTLASENNNDDKGEEDNGVTEHSFETVSHTIVQRLQSEPEISTHKMTSTVTLPLSPSSSPRLPSPPPIPEVQISPRSPTVGEDSNSVPATADDAKIADQSMRRIRPGTKAADMASGPPLVPLNEVSAPLLGPKLSTNFSSSTPLSNYKNI